MARVYKPVAIGLEDVSLVLSQLGTNMISEHANVHRVARSACNFTSYIEACCESKQVSMTARERPSRASYGFRYDESNVIAYSLHTPSLSKTSTSTTSVTFQLSFGVARPNKGTLHHMTWANFPKRRNINRTAMTTWGLTNWRRFQR